MMGKNILIAFAVLAFVNFVSCTVYPLQFHKHDAKSLKAGPSVFPLIGNINQYAEFFINITLGVPPQILRVQVDTGSTDLVVFGTDCYGCPKAPNVTYYDVEKSKTGGMIMCDDGRYLCDINNCYQDDYCPMNIEYGGGGSITGFAVTEQFTLGDLTDKWISLGVIQQLNGPFENLGVDGCWGFAFATLSSWGDDPIVHHLAEDLKMYESFSLCLTPNTATMEIGTDYSKDDRFQWTKIQDDEWYIVEMTDFLVGGTSLGISSWSLNENGVIVDSGTTLVIVSDEMMKAIQKLMTAMCATVDLVGVCNNVTEKESLFTGYCYPMTDAQIAQFPPLTTTLKDLTTPLAIQPQDYLWEGAGVAGEYCFGLQTINMDGIPVILGDVLMQKYHIAFDRQAMKVGFADLSSCPVPPNESTIKI